MGTLRSSLETSFSFTGTSLIFTCSHGSTLLYDVGVSCRCFEKNDFEPDGRRKEYLNIWNGNFPGNVDPSTTQQCRDRGVKRDSQNRETWGVRPDAQVREAYYNLSYGQKADKMKIVAKIKPYVPDEENPRLNDWYRVFGVAIASARPNEMCDIKISRQSM